MNNNLFRSYYLTTMKKLPSFYLLIYLNVYSRGSLLPKYIGNIFDLKKSFIFRRHHSITNYAHLKNTEELQNLNEQY